MGTSPGAARQGKPCATPRGRRAGRSLARGLSPNGSARRHHPTHASGTNLSQRGVGGRGAPEARACRPPADQQGGAMVAHVDVDVGQVWRDYKESPTIELRNQLVEKYLPLVKYNAQPIWQPLPHRVDL